MLRILCTLFLFEVGVVLLFIPWVSLSSALYSGLWDRNYFLSYYPALRPFVLNPSVRGVVSGLGVLDILVAASMLRRQSRATENPGS
jgi:hypothetical protein